MSSQQEYCFFCETPLEGSIVYFLSKNARANIPFFLLAHPEWQTRPFTKSSHLCNQSFCMAAAFEKWRMDTFGVKSPRRSPRRQALEEEEAAVAAAEAAGEVSPQQKQQKKWRGPSSLLNDAADARGVEYPAPPSRPLSQHSRQQRLSRPGSSSIAAAVVPTLNLLASSSVTEREKDVEFERIMAEQRHLLNNVVASTSALDLSATRIKERLTSNRDERLKVAQRLQEMDMSAGDRESRHRALSKQLGLLRKRELYEELLQAKLAHEEMQRKIDEIELEQRIAIIKLEETTKAKMVKVDLSKSQKSDLETIQKVSNSFEPVMKHMQHIDSAQDILDDGLASNNLAQNSTFITQELQQLLRTAYTKAKDDLLQERKQLTAGRIELEEKMELVKEEEMRLYGTTGVALLHDEKEEEDESFDAVFARATNMPVSVDERVEGFSRRIADSIYELEWLEEEPNTQLWHDTKKRIADEQLAIDSGMLRGQNLLQQFFEGRAAREEFDAMEKTAELTDAAIKEITKEILDTALRSMATKVAMEMMSLVKLISAELDSAIIKGITGGSPEDMEYLRVSGREFLYKGALKDFRKKYYRDKCAVSHYGFASYEMQQSMPVLDRVTPVAKERKAWAVDTDNTIAVSGKADAGVLINDRVKRAPVIRSENTYWSKMSLQATGNSPLLSPNIAGRNTFIKVFPRASSSASLIVLGTHFGQFSVWLVPWIGTSAIMYAVSPALPSKQQAQIVDVKEGSLGANQLVTVYKNGHVRVWSLSPIPQANRHSSSMFPAKSTKFEAVVSTCIFHINPLDMSLPTPLDPTGKKPVTAKAAAEASKGKEPKKVEGGGTIGRKANSTSTATSAGGGIFRSAVSIQPGSLPTAVCFHPSITFTGRNCSIMVGAEGGDLIKFNMDFRVDTLDAPIVFLPPFVTVEYVQPVNAPGTVLASSSRIRKGNRVYREVFHFHKAPIIFIDVVKKFSDMLLSVDEGGNIALWRYEKDLFMGLSWFKPLSTALLNFEIKETEYTPAPPTSAAASPQENGVSVDAAAAAAAATAAAAADAGSSKSGWRFMGSKKATPPPSLTSSTSNATILPPPSSGPPTASQLKRLRCKERIMAEDGMLVETYYPIEQVFTKLPEGKERQLVEFQSRRHLNPTRPASATTSSVKGEEEAPEEPPEIIWTSRYVKNFQMSSRMIAVELSQDGTELFFVLSFTKSPIFTNSVSQNKDYLTIVCLNVASMEFTPPYPQFEIKSGDAFRSISVGPISAETLTRVAFVNMRQSGLRVFSLETGQEIVTKVFPFRPNYNNFDAHVFSLCPSQRVAAFAGPTDARVAVYVFSHEDDGKEEFDLLGTSLLKPLHIAGLRKNAETLKSIATATVLAAPVREEPEYMFAKLLAERVVEYVWRRVEKAIDKIIEDDKKAHYIEDLYGPHQLGTVEPTRWPVDPPPPSSPDGAKIHLQRLEEEAAAVAAAAAAAAASVASNVAGEKVDEGEAEREGGEDAKKEEGGAGDGGDNDNESVAGGRAWSVSTSSPERNANNLPLGWEEGYRSILGDEVVDKHAKLAAGGGGGGYDEDDALEERKQGAEGGGGGGGEDKG